MVDEVLTDSQFQSFYQISGDQFRIFWFNPNDSSLYYMRGPPRGTIVSGRVNYTSPTFSATYRLNSRPYALSNVFAAAGRKQFATIFHTVTSTKLVRLKHVLVALESSSAAAIVMAELVKLTTPPATGNPVLVVNQWDGKEAVVDSSCLALPTNDGTELNTQPHSMTEWNLGITAGGSTVNPPPPLTFVDLANPGPWPDFDQRMLYMNKGVAEGWAVTIDVSAATTVKAYAIIFFTES